MAEKKVKKVAAKEAPRKRRKQAGVAAGLTAPELPAAGGADHVGALL